MCLADADLGAGAKRSSKKKTQSPKPAQTLKGLPSAAKEGNAEPLEAQGPRLWGGGGRFGRRAESLGFKLFRDFFSDFPGFFGRDFGLVSLHGFMFIVCCFWVFGFLLRALSLRGLNG